MTTVCILLVLQVVFFGLVFQDKLKNMSLSDNGNSLHVKACISDGEEQGLNYHDKDLQLHGGMEELPGAFGTSASFALRLGQTVFSSASLLFMCLDADFYGYTAFCYLVTVMGLVISWSITLLMVDAYSVFIKCIPQQRRLILIIFLGDMVLSYLSLAAACSTASVTDLLLDADESYCPEKSCSRYQLSAAMAFLAWFLSSASFLFNFWLFPSL